MYSSVDLKRCIVSGRGESGEEHGNCVCGLIITLKVC